MTAAVVVLQTAAGCIRPAIYNGYYETTVFRSSSPSFGCAQNYIAHLSQL